MAEKNRGIEVFKTFKINNFIKKYVEEKEGSLVLVKCETISPRLLKSIQKCVHKKGMHLHIVEYTEKGLGEHGIMLALKKYYKTKNTPFYVIAVRGKSGLRFLHVYNNGLIQNI